VSDVLWGEEMRIDGVGVQIYVIGIITGIVMVSPLYFRISSWWLCLTIPAPIIFLYLIGLLMFRLDKSKYQ
jgi:hypothetical protein